MKATAVWLLLALPLMAGTGPLPEAGAADWPQWRGPGRDGISRETGLAGAWPKGGPKVLWRAALGGGYSGVAVTDGRAFTHTARNKKEEIVLCFDAATGQERWRYAYPCDYDRYPTLNERYDSGPRATPAVSGGRVYTLGTTGVVLCLDAASGKRIWQADLLKLAGVKCPRYGYCGSPLIVGDLLHVHLAGSKGKCLAALNVKDGTLAWQALDDRASCASPIHIEHQGTPQVVHFTGEAVLAVAPRDGKLLWRFPWERGFEPHCATPVYGEGKLFVSSAHAGGAAVLQVRAGGVPQAVWKSDVMLNQFSTSVLYQGHLYGFSSKRLRCVEFATGKKQWDRTGLGRGTLLVADVKLLILGEYGELVLAEANPRAYVEKGRCQVLEGECVTAPALADGRLFLRNERTLLALEVKATSRSNQLSAHHSAAH